MSILALYLCLVSTIGLSFGPFEGLSFRFYNFFAQFGTNPSFTPVTVDMSMMTSVGEINNFGLPLHLKVKTQEEGFKVILAKEMDLYLHKIPLILFMEQASENVDLKEARYALCHSFSLLCGTPVQSFAVLKGIDQKDILFDKEFSCEDMEFER